jgi:hypothetical protein
MFSHEGLPLESETLEYAWLIEAVVGTVSGKLTTPQVIVFDAVLFEISCTQSMCMWLSVRFVLYLRISTFLYVKILHGVFLFIFAHWQSSHLHYFAKHQCLSTF